RLPGRLCRQRRGCYGRRRWPDGRDFGAPSMLRDEITRRIEQAARAAQTAGEIPAVALPEVMLERPQRAENGDFATSLALRLKKAAGRGSDTLEMAKAIAARIERDDLVQQAAAAPPGFINVTLN